MEPSPARNGELYLDLPFFDRLYVQERHSVEPEQHVARSLEGHDDGIGSGNESSRSTLGREPALLAGLSTAARPGSPAAGACNPCIDYPVHPEAALALGSVAPRVQVPMAVDGYQVERIYHPVRHLVAGG